MWHGDTRGDAALLRGCYANSLALAAENGLRSLAFPSISTGAYRYPIEQAARIAVQTVRECLQEPSTVGCVLFVCFDARDLAVYERILGETPAAQ